MLAKVWPLPYRLPKCARAPACKRPLRATNQEGGSLTTMKPRTPKLILSQETLRLLVSNKPSQYLINGITTLPWCPTGAGPNGGQR